MPWLAIFISLLSTLNHNPPAKFDFCIFILTGDNRGVPKFKRRSRDLGHAPFSTNFSFLCLVFLTLDPAAKFDVSSFLLTGDNRGSQNSKVVHVTWVTPLLTQFFIFGLVFPTLDPAAKFGVCSFILTGDNRAVPKFKSRSRDLGHAPFWPNFSYFV